MQNTTKFELDDWQKEVMKVNGNLVLRSGRQVGKSEVVSRKAAEYAVANKKKSIMVIASVERQSYLLFEKILSYLVDNHKKMIKTGKDRPTKHKVNLVNGSVIYSLPTGMSGYGIRGFTIHLLIADEAAFIPEDVWTAVTPMLAVTKGILWLLSTPFGKGGYFYRCFKDKTFTTFHVSSEDCPRKSEEFLAQERRRMTKVQYAQEYLGEFIDELSQFFDTELIKRSMTLKEKNPKVRTGENNFMGVDVARLGKDETVCLSVYRINNERVEMFDMDIGIKKRITETARTILSRDYAMDYKKIYVDDGGVGGGVFDILLEDDQTKRKVVAINNAARSIDNKDRRKKILKEDLYNNLLTLMEHGKIDLIESPELFQSLKSIQYEYTDAGKIEIYGNYSHIAEALIRAAWCMKDKTLNIYVY